MAQFSRSSLYNLDRSDPRLQVLFKEVIKEFDCTILESHRGREKQDRMVREGKSKVSWPNSKHNHFPSLALDVAPYPIDWSNTPKALARFYHLAGYVKGIANRFGIKIRWGGDWDSDKIFTDQNFDDLPHFEIDD